jgi:hypothetical protein
VVTEPVEVVAELGESAESVSVAEPVEAVSGGVSTVCSTPKEQAVKTKTNKTTVKNKLFKFFNGTLFSF